MKRKRFAEEQIISILKCSATNRMRRRIASPELLLWLGSLPHVKCSPGRSLWEHWNEEGKDDGTGRVG